MQYILSPINNFFVIAFPFSTTLQLDKCPLHLQRLVGRGSLAVKKNKSGVDPILFLSFPESNFHQMDNL